VGLHDGGSRRGDCGARTDRGPGDGSGRPHPGLCGGGDRWPRQLAGSPHWGTHCGMCQNRGHHALSRNRAGLALSDCRSCPFGTAYWPVWHAMIPLVTASRTLKPLRLLLYVAPLLLLLLLVPYLTAPYQAYLLSYGLIMAIAALGFNLLMGYTG